MKYKLWCILSRWRDNTPEPLTTALDWIRYEVLYDHKDERHHYE